MSTENVIIIGSGPAGLTAAIYAARADLNPIVIAGYEAGGQLMITTDVENFPGFPEGIQGPELMERMEKQAERFGTRIIKKNATKVDFTSNPFTVWVGSDEYKTKTVIIATGASARWLGIESEQRLIGRGVSACATCDAFFFRNKKVAVVGGGDSAMEEALYLTKFAKEVHILHRRDELRASKIMQKRAMNNEKITIRWSTVVEEVLGEERVTGLRLKSTKTGEVFEEEFDGLFLAIGHTPNTELFKDQIELHPTGYIVVHDNTKTSVEGVFTCGDVNDHHYRQAITAAGMGAMAGIDAKNYLESLDD